MTQTIYVWIIEQAKRHGLGFVLLMVAVYYLNKKVDDMSAKYDASMDSQIKYLKEDRNQMIIVIENNTAMMQKLVDKMEKK